MVRTRKDRSRKHRKGKNRLDRTEECKLEEV